MSKIGLVVEGGGMKCAYGAGVLDIFLDEGITFDYAIGVSAGSANTASFLAGQRGRNKRFYTEFIHDSLYFGFKSFIKTGNAFNLDYIYSDLSNTGAPAELHFDKIMENPCEYEIVATNARTGQPAYFDKSEMIKDDYCHIKASSAIPALSKAQKVGDDYYFDGGISDSIPVERAMEKGCDKMVVISSKPRSYVKNPEKMRLLYAFFCRKFPAAIKCMDERHIMYRREQAKMFELEKEGKAFLFCPDESITVSTYTMDEATNQKLYDNGVADAKAYMEDLKKFLSE